MLEYSREYSVGRGTDAPFEQIGADWMKGPAFAAELNARYIPGVRVYPTRFTPGASRFEGRTIEGVRFVVTNRDVFNSSLLGLEIAAAIQRLYPEKSNLEDNLRLIGSRRTAELIKAGEDPRWIQQDWEEPLQAFAVSAKEYHLYK